MKALKLFGILILWILFLFGGIFIIVFHRRGINKFYDVCDWFVDKIKSILG